MKDSKERIVCIISEDCNEVFPEQFTESTPTLLCKIAHDPLSYDPARWFAYTQIERDKAEKDETKKQLVVYIAIKHKDTMLIYRRSKQEGEKRLHGKWGLIGGHINENDWYAVMFGDKVSRDGDKNLTYIIQYAANREFHEECSEWLGYDKMITPEDFKIEGFINCNETPVDKVHLGILVSVNLNHQLVNYDDKDTSCYIHFLNFKEIFKDKNKEKEQWLNIILNNYKPV